MKRRDLLRAVVAIPVVAALPAIAVALPVTTYTYHTTVTLPPIRWVPITEYDPRATIFPPPSKEVTTKRLIWQKGLS